MRKRVLSEARFKQPVPGWDGPHLNDQRFEPTGDGLVVRTVKGWASVNGSGVHTRNGDAIELHFQVLKKKKGRLRFGFSGGME